MVIGGQAVLLWGEARLTNDIDITLGVGPERTQNLIAIAREQGWLVLAEHPEQFAKETCVLPLRDEGSGVRLDFIFSFTPFEREAIARAQTELLHGMPVRFASREDLIVLKIFAGRPRDLEDVRGILLKQPHLNRKWIRNTLHAFSDGADDTLTKRFDGLLAGLRSNDSVP